MYLLEIMQSPVSLNDILKDLQIIEMRSNLSWTFIANFLKECSTIPGSERKAFGRRPRKELTGHNPAVIGNRNKPVFASVFGGYFPEV